MRIGIIGGGSIGLLLASHLGAVHKVSLYVRTEKQKKAVNENGVICDGMMREIKAYSNNEQMKEQDLLIVAVKQYHLQSLTLPSNPDLLFLQNGMTHLSFIQHLPNNCALGIVEHGAMKASEYEVFHTGNGSIRLANHHGKEMASQLVDLLGSEKFPIYFHDDYWNMLSEKLIINTVINPLTAIFKVNNKYILENDHIRKLAELLCEEGSRALGLIHEEQWQRICRIAQSTGENQSSMLKDLNEERKTEIDAICGFILKKLEGEAPYHNFVIESVHALEAINYKGEAI
ncbi:ketopantoate reductase family protein [Halobacillus campisalis]|uniref:2-dehydropantoate 2-reductase n=1 Tax=Halobacillus campisalis TaxID=435909 RepID=A0ABW2K2K2_9BACI|nr:2-dehydropantoate 2-reductase [Halobacillus campisalis]